MNNRYVPFVIVALLLTSIATAHPINSANHNQFSHTIGSATVYYHEATADDIAALMDIEGVYEEGTNYNIIIDGFGTGLRPPTIEEWSRIASYASIVDSIVLNSGIDALPPSIDHSESIHFPPIGSQGQEGSCVAWAVGYYAKTYQEAVEREWDFTGASWSSGQPTPAYQDKIMSPDFIYHQINRGIDGGAAYIDAINLVCNIGASSWALMPYDQYDSTTWPTEAAWREAPLYRGEGGYTSVQFSTAGIDALKTLLVNGTLGIISIDANQYGDMQGDIWTTDTYQYLGTNHANTVVGYDDTKAYTENGETHYGAFKIVNSWGPTWSGDGTYWISYDAMEQVVRYFMYYYDKDAYDPTSVAVFTIDHDNRHYADIVVGMGEPSSSTEYKYLEQFVYDGGNHPFPDNAMVLDISELGQISDDMFLLLTNRYGTSGTIEGFSIETYPSGYDSTGDTACFVVSEETPKLVEAYTSEAVFCQTGMRINELTTSVGSMPADGESSATIEAEVTYLDGSGVDDGTVVLFAASLGTLSASSATTVGGIATVTLTAGTSSGEAIVTASAGVSQQQVSVQLIGLPAEIVVSPASSRIYADGASTSIIEIEVTDDGGQPVIDGTEVTVTTTNGTLDASAVTTSGGTCTVTLTSTDTPAEATITAQSGVAEGTATVTFVGDPATAEIEVTPETLVPDGTSEAAVTVLITDERGEPVLDGSAVALSASGGTLGDETLETVDGQVETTLVAGTYPQIITLTATSGTAEDTASVVCAGNPEDIAITIDVPRLPADGASKATITIRVQDGDGYPVLDGTIVTVSSDYGTLSDTTAATTNGNAEIEITAHDTPVVAEITATYDTLTEYATLPFVGSAASLSITCDPTSVPADGHSATEIAVEVTDVNDQHVVDGTLVSLSVSAGTLDADVQGTIDGIATFVLTSPTEPQTISIDAQHEELLQSGSVEATEPSVTTTVQLYHGWNSVCLPHATAMDELVQGITGNIDGYLYWFKSSEQRYLYYNIVELTDEPEYPSEFSTLPCGENIWIWLFGESGSLEVTGIPEDAPLDLVVGWNVIGHYGTEERPMTELVAELDGTGADYDGYLYWLNPEQQRYYYYNIVEKTNEPEYPSEFDTMYPNQVYWVYCFEEEVVP